MIDEKIQLSGADVRREYILFPYDKIPYQSRIIIYGAGDIGKILYDQIFNIQYCKVVAFADRSAKGIHFKKGIPPCIMPDEIKNQEYDYLVLAITRGVNLVLDSLVELGIDKEKIVVLGNGNIVKMSMSRFNSYIQSEDNSKKEFVEMYSNGEDEEKIFSNHREFIRKEKIWTERINLYEWYNFEHDKSVLVYAEDYGIVANFFCTFSKDVIAITNEECNQKMSKIRTSKYSNITYVKTVDEIADDMVFDYIIVQEKELTESFMSGIARILKSDGIMFVSGKNKFSFRHWANLADDVADDSMFQGIHRKELEIWQKKLFENHRITYFFPVSDSVAPVAMFSERFLPQVSSIRGNVYTHLNLDMVYDAVVANEIYDKVPDSFLVIFEPLECKKSEVVFVNYKKDRRKDYRVSTIIKEVSGEKYVWKKALNENAVHHVQKMLNTHDLLKKVYHEFEVADVKKIDKYTIEFPFLEGESLDYLLWAHHKDEKYVLNYIRMYLDKMRNISADYRVPFEKSKEFCTVFGDVNYEGNAIISGNLDAIFDNIIILNDTWTFFDYEWIFDFAVPEDFFVYRSIDVFFRKYRGYFQIDMIEKIWNETGILDKNIGLFQKMNQKLWEYFSEKDQEKTRFAFVNCGKMMEE